MTIYKRLFVYWICIHTFLLTEGIVYLGCYQDGWLKGVLNVKLTNSNSNTPEECARRCMDFRYVGVESNDECFCGDSFNEVAIPESYCAFRCSGDDNKICGGRWSKISVYTNWDCGPSPEIASGHTTLRKGTNITYGSIADVYCDQGFESKPTITCFTNTSWEKTTCEQTGTPSILITTPSSRTTQIQTTDNMRATSPTTTSTSTVKTVTSPITTHSKIVSTSTNNGQTSGTTHTTRDNSPTTTNTTSLDTATSPKPIQSTTSLSAIDGQSAASKQADKGSTTTAVAAGVSVTVVVAVSAVVIVLVLRNRRKLCFENTNSSKLKNRDDDHHISLARVKSKPTAYDQIPGTSVSNKMYSALQNASTCTKDADKNNPVAYTDGNFQNTNITQRNQESEARVYFVLDKYGCDEHRSAINAIPTEVHAFFVLEKQQPNIGNINGVSTNEVHPYFVLEREGDRPVHDIPPQEGNAYFVLEKQTNGHSPPMNTANALDLDKDDGDTYQEIDSKDTYADIGDLREDKYDYNYTNKGFKDSRNKNSDNIYNHLNYVGDEYDHVGKRKDNVNAMENNYDVTSGAVRK